MKNEKRAYIIRYVPAENPGIDEVSETVYSESAREANAKARKLYATEEYLQVYVYCVETARKTLVIESDRKREYSHGLYH